MLSLIWKINGTSKEFHSDWLILAKSNGFSQSWNKVYIVEDQSIKRFFNSDKKDEIPKSALSEFSNYEKYFDGQSFKTRIFLDKLIITWNFSTAI